MTIGETVQHLLNDDKTAIEIDVPFGPEGFFNVNHSVLVSWYILLFTLIVCFIFTRNLKTRNISTRQTVVEFISIKLRDLSRGMLGEHAPEYAEYIAAVLTYLALANVIGLIGVHPPTMDINVTAALAGMSIILIQIVGIRKRKPLGYLKSFIEPIPVMLPFNLLELLIKPVSLCMRLFGNIVGATVVMVLIRFLVAVGVPALVGLYFEVFDGLLQAYIFTFLTALYIKEASEVPEKEATV